MAKFNILQYYQFGGQHITNDLAIGLKTDLDIAEAVKLQHANLRPEVHKNNVTIKINSKSHDFEFEEISVIVEARVDELFEYVDKELQKIKRSRKLPGGIVITGGTAKLPGIDEFARQKLQLPARIGKLQNIGGLADTVADPGFVTVVGLMLLDMLLLPALPPNTTNRTTQNARALFTNVFSRFKH